MGPSQWQALISTPLDPRTLAKKQVRKDCVVLVGVLMWLPWLQSVRVGSP